MLDAHCQMLMDEFIENESGFEEMKSVVLSMLKRVLEDNGIIVTGVEARVKTRKSLEGKLELKGYKYSELSDITDLMGARIITFYSDEVDKISALVESMFEIDWENSVDKRKMYDPDRFGYMSLHYICRIPETLYRDARYPAINNYKFEIQMRTALQHVWATAYHDTGYKSDIEVPREYIRSLSRLAGVLEIADEEFRKIRSELEEYRRKVKALVKDGKFDDVALDGDSFSNYIEIGPFDRLNEQIAGINHAEIQPASFRQYLEVFKKFGFNTLGDIEKFKNEYQDAAYQLAVHQMGGTDLDIFASTLGLQNMCIAYILKRGDGVNGLKAFYDIVFGERPRNAASAKRMYEQAKNLNLVPEE